MKYYPINLNLKDRNCLVIGGGSVGERKIRTLLKCGGNVTVISPKINVAIKELFELNKIKLKKRKYISGDIKKFFIVIGATNNDLVNCQISKDAFNSNILCNIVDSPDICSFILPAIISKGDLQIAISTSGKSPALSKKIKKNLNLKFSDGYKELVDIMGAIRYELLSFDKNFREHKKIFKRILSSNMLSLIKMKKVKRIDLTISRILEKNYKYKDFIASRRS